MEYTFGILLGIVVALFFFLVCGKLLYKKQYKDKAGYFHEKKIYDERQLMARGRAYKGGYFALMISLVALLIANESVKDVNLMNYSGVFTCIIISVGVFAIICIINDAYMSLYESAKKVLVMLVLLAVLNIAIGVSELISDGGIIKTKSIMIIGDYKNETKELSDSVSSLLVGIAILVICVVFLVKVSHDNKVASEDEFEEE